MFFCKYLFLISHHCLFSVFGRNGLYMVLKGSVRPLTYPYLNSEDNVIDSRTPTPLVTDECKDIVSDELKYTSTQNH